MKNSIRKKITSFVIALCILLGGVGLLNFGTINLKTSATSASGTMCYYYSQLSDNEKRFYDAIDKMNTNGVLKTGEAYDLVLNKVVSQNEIFEYSDGNSALLKQFRAAKDAFSLDHPEVFWIDFDLLSLSLGKKGDAYTATIDAGRYDSYFAPGFTTTNLENEITVFSGDDGIKANLPEDEGLTAVQIVEQVAKNICRSSRISYVDSQSVQILNSAYGVAVKGYATPAGYSKAFKLCMDLMDIECVQVNGYRASEKEDSLLAHSWNYVKLSGKWYAVDVALNEINSTSKNILIGKEFMKTHIEDMVVSTDSKQFKVPTLASENYYNSLLQVSAGKVNGEFVAEFSYNDKSATELAERDLYLVVFNETTLDESKVDFGTAKAWKAFETDASEKSTVAVSAFVPFVKVGVTTLAPNAQNIYEELTNNDLLCFEVVENEMYFTGTGLKRPWVESVKVSNADGSIVYNDASNVELDAFQTWTVTVTYDEALRKADLYNPIGMSVGLLNDDSDIKSYVSVSDVVWNEETPKQISFKFTPSVLAKHNGAEYVFMPFNFMNTSGIDLRPVYSKLTFVGHLLSANKIMKEERLYVTNYTKPTLIDSSVNLIEQGWKNSLGVSFNSNQIEQFTLVSATPMESKQQAMIAGIKTTFSLENADILESDMFNLHINIDGIVKNIPVNAYVQYAFAYPEGYNFDSIKKGVVFKVFTFEKDVYGNYDYSKAVEVDSVATKSGIIVSANTLESVVICALDLEDEPTKQTVYSRAINAGGSIECVGEINANKKVAVVSNESISYSIVAEKDYQIDYVLVNGKDVTKDVKNNVLTILKSDLVGNNVVEVAFESKTVAAAENDENVTNLDASYAANEQVVYVPKSNNAPQKSNTALIVVIVSVSVAVAIAAIVITIIILKKKVLKNKK